MLKLGDDMYGSAEVEIAVDRWDYSVWSSLDLAYLEATILLL